MRRTCVRLLCHGEAEMKRQRVETGRLFAQFFGTTCAFALPRTHLLFLELGVA